MKTATREGLERELMESLDIREADNPVHAGFVEIFNAISNPKYNDRAMVEAVRYSVPGLSNSDDHNAKPGRGYTVLGIEPEENENIDDTVDAIKGAIKDGNIVSYNKEYTGFLEKLWIFMGKDVSAGHFGSVANRVGRVLKIKK